ncbi:MAG: Dyp-type peroxidase, partial [Pseudomonadota bacterium]
TPKNFETLLHSMIFKNEEGNYDHLLDFTQAETGAAFFVPSLNFLARLADKQ